MSGRRIRRGARMVLTVSILVSTLASPAWAHPHTVDADGDGVAEATLANGQNHGPFQAGKSCGGDPAAYGLESAHHGPDAGTPGKADDDAGSRGNPDDGCYETTGGVAPGADLGPAAKVIK